MEEGVVDLGRGEVVGVVGRRVERDDEWEGDWGLKGESVEERRGNENKKKENEKWVKPCRRDSRGCELHPCLHSFQKDQ